MQPIASLPSVERISEREFVEDYLIPMRPLVFAGGAGDWPAIAKWTDDHLKATAGSEPLQVKPKADYLDGGSRRETEAVEVIRLRDAIGRIADNAVVSYARESDLLSRSSALAADVHVPSFLKAAGPLAPGRTENSGPIMWLGPANTVAQLHWDPEHNLFVQVRGKKRFIVVPPGEIRLTYPNTFTVNELSERPFFRGKGADLLHRLSEAAALASTPVDRQAEFHRRLLASLSEAELSLLCDFLLETNNCHVDAADPDLSEHPAFSEAHRQEVVLGPGDMLFLPYFWLHSVRSLEPSISVNWFFLPEMLRYTLSAKNNASILVSHLAP